MFLSTHYSLLYIYLYMVNVFKYLFLLFKNKNKVIVTRFFYKKVIIRPQKLKKMLRKYPLSNALASNFKNLEFCKSYKID